MKKMFAVVVGLLFFGTCTFSESASADTVTDGTYQAAQENTPILESFNKMQDEITNHLKVENGQYVYSYEEIQQIVNEFDFDSLARKTDLSYTKESFLELAISRIETTTFTPSIAPRIGKKYNVNSTEKGWNYQRWFMDTKNTNELIYNLEGSLRDIKTAIAAGGLLGGGALAAYKKVPYVGSILVGVELSFTYGNWRGETWVADLKHCNNGYGTVSDLNIFTLATTVWDQKDF